MTQRVRGSAIGGDRRAPARVVLLVGVGRPLGRVHLVRHPVLRGRALHFAVLVVDRVGQRVSGPVAVRGVLDQLLLGLLEPLGYAAAGFLDRLHRRILAFVWIV